MLAKAFAVARAISKKFKNSSRPLTSSPFYHGGKETYLHPQSYFMVQFPGTPNVPDGSVIQQVVGSPSTNPGPVSQHYTDGVREALSSVHSMPNKDVKHSIFIDARVAADFFRLIADAFPPKSQVQVKLTMHESVHGISYLTVTGTEYTGDFRPTKDHVETKGKVDGLIMGARFLK